MLGGRIREVPSVTPPPLTIPSPPKEKKSKSKSSEMQF